ncbi:MAG: flippase-like domain-containing protein [Anaerolineales bacterium]|nr:flippase-like domain-containing protein [Anaerolineales bacterium]
MKSPWLENIKKWRNILSPIIGVGVLFLFGYWLWNYRLIIFTSLKQIGFTQVIITILLMLLAMVLTVLVLVILVRDKGYTFTFADGYHTLNLSQLASMIPGGVWGFAGFAGFLWSRGVSKIDSAIIIFLNTLIMLSACAVVGLSGLISILGWGYAVLCFIPFIFLIFARNRLEEFRKIYFPESSTLPSVKTLLQAAGLGILVWLITAFCFAWMLFSASVNSLIPIQVAVGAYAAGYLGGYLTFLVPSGLGVSEGLTTLILSSYMKAENILAVAISFRILHTLIIWANIIVSVFLTSKRKKDD